MRYHYFKTVYCPSGFDDSLSRYSIPNKNKCWEYFDTRTGKWERGCNPTRWGKGKSGVIIKEITEEEAFLEMV